MATVETKRMTADEFFVWLQQVEKGERIFELERGEIVEMPSPGELHGMLCALLAHLLWRFVFQRGRGYVCSNDTGLLVESDPDTVRGPDLMLFDEQRKLEELSRKFAVGIPKLVVEVMSPSDQQTKTNRRISQYLARGVPLVWLVDPEVRSVTVYRQGASHTVLDETEELTGDGALPDLRLKVAELFTVPGQAN
jgi:Uma2 family endonuclease